MYNQQRSMNKHVSVIMVLASALLVGGCTLFGAPPTKNSEPTPTPVASEKKSLKDLFAAGISQKCTFSSNEGGANAQGTVYATSGKSRGDFSSVISGQTINSHMIVDGNTSYVWMDGQKQGFISTFDATASEITPGASGETGKVDVNQQADYQCDTWTPDNSMFQRPDGVEFVDMSALIAPSTMPGAKGAGGNSAQCAACNSLTGDSKTQCLSALNCK